MSDQQHFGGSSKSGRPDREADQGEFGGSLGQTQPDREQTGTPSSGLLREGPSGSSPPKPSAGQDIGAQPGTPGGPRPASPSQPARRGGCFGSVLAMSLLVAVLLIGIS